MERLRLRDVFEQLNGDFKTKLVGFPGGSVVKNPPANAGDTGSVLDTERPNVLCRSQTRVPVL